MIIIIVVVVVVVVVVVIPWLPPEEMGNRDYCLAKAVEPMI